MSTPVASDLLLVERPVCTTSMGASAGTTVIYVNSLAAAISSGTTIVFEGTSGGNSEFTLTSAASAGATSITGSGGLKGQSVDPSTVGGVLYKATKTVWDGAASGVDIISGTVSQDITVTTTSSTYPTDAFNILDFQIDVGGSNVTGDLYVGQKNNASTYYYGDIAISAIQIFESDGTTLKYSWSFHHTPYDWATTSSTQSNAATLPTTYSYSTISSTACNTSRKYCRCNPGLGSCVTSGNTGAADGISGNYGTANGSTTSVTSLPSSGTVAQTNNAYFVYVETSSTATGNVYWMRTTGITVSTGDYFRMAYLAASPSSGGSTVADTMWFYFD